MKNVFIVYEKMMLEGAPFDSETVAICTTTNIAVEMVKELTEKFPEKKFDYQKVNTNKLLVFIN